MPGGSVVRLANWRRASLTTTLDLYGHLYPGDMDRYAIRLDDAAKCRLTSLCEMCERPTAEGRYGTLSTGIISQAAWPPHGVDNGCTLRQAQRAGDVEAEALVERHVIQIRGFEVGGQPLLIASLEPASAAGLRRPRTLAGPDRPR